MSINNILDQMSTQFDETKGSGWRYTNLIDSVNGFIYANPTNVKFKDHIKNFIEPYAGAHYYAQGFDSTTYQTASMTVNLSEVEIDRKVQEMDIFVWALYLAEVYISMLI